MVSATRQNAGRFVRPPRPGPPPPGAANSPEVMSCAVVIVASGSDSFASDSHEAGAACATRGCAMSQSVRDAITALRIMSGPPEWPGSLLQILGLEEHSFKIRM